MKVLFFKAIYIIRKKVTGLKNRYLVSEYKYLFPERVILPKGFKGDPLPGFHFDNSKSRLIIHPNVVTRGHTDFLFFNDGVIEVGANTFMNSNCSVNCVHQITIGENCLFGENVKLYDHNHVYKDKSKLIKDQGYATAPIIIGNNCWFGSNVTILKGVSIGDNVVVGANCIIHRDIPAGSLLVSDAANQVTKQY